MALVTFPDGSRVRPSPISERREDDPERAFGIYLDMQWNPTWPACVIDWPDFGLPPDPNAAAIDIAAAFDRARRGELVEVGCLGGRGRTGTVLACMAVLAGVPGDEAVEWIRQAYRREAVETPAQEEWVQWFADWASRQPAAWIQPRPLSALLLGREEGDRAAGPYELRPVVLVTPRTPCRHGAEVHGWYEAANRGRQRAAPGSNVPREISRDGVSVVAASDSESANDARQCREAPACSRSPRR